MFIGENRRYRIACERLVQRFGQRLWPRVEQQQTLERRCAYDATLPQRHENIVVIDVRTTKTESEREQAAFLIFSVQNVDRARIKFAYDRP